MTEINIENKRRYTFMTQKFQIGDIVIPNENAQETYAITTLANHWIGQVMGEDSHGFITVKTLVCDDGYKGTFKVHAGYFEAIGNVNMEEYEYEHILESLQAAQDGMYETIAFIKSIFNCLEKAHLEKRQKEFKPILQHKYVTDTKFVIGEPTELRDISGERLYVGDLVTVRSNLDEMNCFVLPNNINRFKFIDEDFGPFGWYKGSFYTIQKKASYRELQNGYQDDHCNLKAIMHQ